jgi:putative glutamine amidotransferase
LSGSESSGTPPLLRRAAAPGRERGRTAPLVPVIGLTTYRQQAQTGVWDVEASFLPSVYLDAVTAAGGIAMLLPPQPADRAAVDEVLDRLDGLIVTGGRDVAPTRYGQQPHPETDEPTPYRDDWEDTLLTAAIDRELPFLGICRGLQVLNVARGGTLLQHLPDVVGDTRYNAGGGVFSVTEVAVDAESKVGELLGRALPVKSYHHQAVDAVGDGLTVTARSADGIVQAVELDSVPFGVAVQWHPEEDAAEDARLFAGLVDAARTYRSVRA